jgi:tetratricopeptide (TPR) repeat protein
MLRKPWRLLILLVGLVALFSCATEPEVTPEEPEPAPVEQPEPEAPLPVSQRTEAEDLRDTILAYDLAQFDAEAFEAGEENFAAAEAAYEIDNEMARREYEAAIDRYNEVIDAGIAGLRERKTEEILTAKAQADELRASKAVPVVYERGERAAQVSAQRFEEGEYVEAYRVADQAIEQYNQAYRRALELRQQAQAALNSAEERGQRSREQIDEYEEDLRDAEEELGNR